MRIIRVISIWLEFMIKCVPLISDLLEAMQKEHHEKPQKKEAHETD